MGRVVTLAVKYNEALFFLNKLTIESTTDLGPVLIHTGTHEDYGNSAVIFSPEKRQAIMLDESSAQPVRELLASLET